MDKKEIKKVLFILGTRPEIIKLAPVIHSIKGFFKVKVCFTGQHKEMAASLLNFFDIIPDYNLNIMKLKQTLFDSTSEILKKLKPVLENENPDICIVQGDTTTALVGSLASFYQKIPLVHIEAGLRSFNKYAPFPEEINRIIVDHLADYHFATTERARENLLKEGISKEQIWVVGNTVIDAFFLTLSITQKNEDNFYKFFDFIDFSKKIILVTGHRRESFGQPFKNICYALKEIAMKYGNEVIIIYPVHLNPNVRKPVFTVLKDIKNVYLIEPLDYPYLVWIMSKSYLILTDSGGIQEEAPSLGKPVIVMREVTERIEGIKAGIARLVGTDKEKIIDTVIELLENEEEYNKMSKIKNPYGDGKSSERIKNILKEIL